MVGNWVRRQAEEGVRILVVDPITAADAGDNRWRADDDFVLGLDRTLSETGASLILVTHPKKAGRANIPTGHDQAGGAAFFRFSDTDIWFQRTKKPRKVEMRRTRQDVPFRNALNLFAVILKSRHGRGAGMEIGFEFGEGLKFVEQGIVTREVGGDDGNELAM
jgi:hypothetical protein